MNADRTTSPGDGHEETFVVGVGASAGGLEALKLMFEQVPEDCPHCFVVVQHLSPDHKSMMAELLGKVARLRVCTLSDDDEIRPGTVYLLPPRKDVTLEAERLVLHEKSVEELRLPIDRLFRSLAKHEGERAIGIVLSGTGSDGTQGLRAIKEAGGMVMVQAPEQAKFDGMPVSAIRTQLVDFVLPAGELPVALSSFIRHFYDVDRRRARVEAEGSSTSSLENVLKVVQRASGIDFRPYKPVTLRRRIERRMSINRCEDVEDYLGLLYQEPGEAHALVRDFLIGVTKFFRDADAWEVLSGRLLPDLVARKKSRPGEPIRVWSAGCSTGEEAYTLGMLLCEELHRQELETECKVFATDLLRGGLEVASRGIYPTSIDADVPAPYRQRYFRREGTDYRVVASLRNMMLFSAHDMLRDPPFSRMDLVVCRNALIYLQPSAQQRALRVLQYALNVGGVLFLGPSESITPLELEFEPVDTNFKFYRNTRTLRHMGDDNLGQRISRGAVSPKVVEVSPVPAMDRSFTEAAVASLGIVAIYVSHDFEILRAEGDLRRYLALPEQGFSSNLVELLPPSVAAMIRQAALGYSADQGQIRLADVSLSVGDEERVVDVVVRAFAPRPQSPPCYLVMFVPAGAEREGAVERGEAWVEHAPQLLGLEEELRRTRAHLQSALEEADTTNEELQATNEELLASNEELQSVNEELQSVNEELHSVNAEFQQKLTDLAQANADMDNLMRSTQIGTLFLDADMRIRKFTPTVMELFKLHDIDIGRPLEHFATALVGERSTEIVETARAVMRDGKVNTNEVQVEGGKHFLRRIDPFRRSNDGHIDGVVLSFVDITRGKHTESRLRGVIAAQGRALEQGGAVSWEYCTDRALPMSPSLSQRLGYRRGELLMTSATLERILDAEALAGFAAFLEGTGDDYEGLLRLRGKDGAAIVLHHVGHVIGRASDGRPCHVWMMAREG